MGKRYEMTRRCAHIRSLIEENKYTKALEQIDELVLADVGSIEDLYLFADMYERAERMDMTKKILYLIYERTQSKHTLSRLLHLVIRMGDMEEARELFMTYEVVRGVTLDTYELRYFMAKTEGEPRNKLIEILEELKKEEYTEEWGYQLARLYEQEGLREKCIQECDDLKLWFGEGSIIDKAMELKKKCEAPDWEPPKDEEIPEPELPDLEESFSYAAPAVDVMELPENTEPEPLEPMMEMQKEAAEQLEVEKPVEKSMPLISEGVSEPVVTKRETPMEPPKAKPVESLEKLLEEEAEDISDRGIRYLTLKGAITRVKYSQETAHFVFAGGEERITLAVAKRIAKELNHVGYFSAKSIVKISAEKLNKLELAEQTEKLLGGCVLITSAPDLTKKAVEDMLQMVQENGDKIVIMLSGDFDEMDCFLSIYPELSEALSYKIRM